MKLTAKDQRNPPFDIYMCRNRFLAQNHSGEFVELNEKMLRTRLYLHGWPKPKKKGDEDTVNPLLERISQTKQVDLYTPLAGNAPGLHINNNVRVLVPRGVPIIPAVEGDWQIARTLLENMFGEEQLKYFFTWWKTARWRLVNHRWIPLQSIVLAGPPGAGKTTLLWLLGKSLGRKASPFEYIIGHTAFNEDLASAELLAMDDEHSSALDQKSQDRLTDFLKWTAVKPDHRVHPKGQKAHQLNVITVPVICTNTEPQNLKIIPTPSESDMSNRQHLFMCSKAPMPMAVTTAEEKQAFYAKLESMVSAIHYFLDEESEVPSDIADPDGRFPCKAWQHPELLSVIMKESKVMKFRNIVLSVITEAGWYRASDLAVKMEKSDLKRAARTFACDVQLIGNLLAKWKELCPTEIRDQKKVQGINKWRIVPPPGEGDKTTESKC